MIQPDENTGRYPVLRTSHTEERRDISGRRSLVLKRDNFRCVFCGSRSRLEADHIVPWSAGGTDDLDNLRTLCHLCNTKRSNFAVPADDFRRLPNGHECVHCAPYLIGEPDLTAVYCIACNRKAPGIPRHDQIHPEAEFEEKRREALDALQALIQSGASDDA